MSDSDGELDHAKSDAIARVDSKLFNSIDTYGTNSYYYAHKKSKEFIIPDGAKVVEGPGIITGGTPVKIADGTPIGRVVVRRKIEKYSWCDDGSKVRIYIDDPSILPLISESGDAVSSSFESQSLSVEVRQSDDILFCLEIPSLSDEVDPAKSSHKVSVGKRITVTLTKKGDQKWYELKKKQW